MNAQKIRTEYLKFFADRHHAVIKRAPLVLNDDQPRFYWQWHAADDPVSFRLGPP